MRTAEEIAKAVCKYGPNVRKWTREGLEERCAITARIAQRELAMEIEDLMCGDGGGTAQNEYAIRALLASLTKEDGK